MPSGAGLPDHDAGAGRTAAPARAIAAYYNEFYDAGISPENFAVFAGGRPDLFAILAFLLPEIRVAIEETEYTPYYDMLQVLGREYTMIRSDAGNRFRPTLADHPDGDGVLRMIRFSFGPLSPDSYEGDMEILARCV